MSVTDPSNVVFTVKELLQDINLRLNGLDQKLDLRLVSMDERITHIERTQAERQHLIAEHQAMRRDVALLMQDRSNRGAIYGDRRVWFGIGIGLIPAFALLLQHLA